MENETTAIDAAQSVTAAGEVAAAELALTNLVVQLEKALAAAVGAAPGLPGALGDALGTLPDGSLLTIAAALLVAYAIERGIRYVLAQRPVDAIGEGFEARVTAGLRWLAGRLLMIALFAVLARLIGRMIVPPDEGAAQLGLSLLAAIVFTRGIAAFLEALAAPAAPARRLMGFGDAAAARAAKSAQVFVVLLFVVTAMMSKSFARSASGAVPSDTPSIARNTFTTK
ncbi:MAG: hypothetical protein AAFQ75_03850, partial [Pseudomonadota bacterium]